MIMENCFSLCADFDLAITNSYFNIPDKWFYTWQHPRSKRWHLLDYLLTRHSNLPDVCITRAMRGADCSTDHHLIRCIFRMDVNITRRRQAANPKRRLNVAKLHTTTGRADLCNSMQCAFATYSTNAEKSINDDRESFRSAAYTVAAESLGYPRRVNAGWFDYNNPAI